MKSNFQIYDYKESTARMKELITSSDNSFAEKDSIPSSDLLTFTNGFYVNCSTIVCDIRDSSKLPDRYNRSKLAKLVKAFISEAVAVLNGSSHCREILIEGDCVWAIYETPWKTDLDDVFSKAATLNSMVKFLNYYLKKNDFDEIHVGIGCSYGRALMIKAGYKGSGINELVWLGDVVNEGHDLCSQASKINGYSRTNPIYTSDVFYSNLNDHNKKLLSKPSYYSDVWSGHVVNSEMDEHYKNNFS